MRAGPVEQSHVSEELEQGAAGGLGHLRGEGFPVLLEFGEADFDELMGLESLLETLEKGGGEAVLTDFEDGLEALGLGFECAFLGGGDEGGGAHLAGVSSMRPFLRSFWSLGEITMEQYRFWVRLRL